MFAIALYKSGYCMINDQARKPFGNKGGGKRGKLSGKVSAASFRRLRSWCIKHDVTGDCWGLTLTVAGLDLVSVDQFKGMHHKLCVWANDNALPLVWRVELQKRGQPHLHCVAFADISVILRFCLQWYKLLDSLPDVYNVETVGASRKDVVLISRAFLHGSQYAIDVQKLQGDFKAWRYLVAHMSKGKREQLGWSGRNWGVCNRSLFSETEGLLYQLPDFVFYPVRRWVRRMTRIKSNRGYSYMLGNPATIKAMIDYASIVNDVPF